MCTPSLAASEAAARVRASLGSRLAAEFTGVAPHVPVDAVAAARALAARERVEVVVALGGGSAIGVAKSIALPSLDPPVGPAPALIAVPTTYAGSEMTPVVGITDRRTGRKRVQRDPAVLPRLAVYDPEVTLDLPPGLTAATAMNALAHCVEASYARNTSPVVAPVALEGIRLIVRSLPACLTDGRDLPAREELLRGAYLAGFSIANATMALHHGLCHALGGGTAIAHGVANAIMLPHVMRFNAEFLPAAISADATATLVASLPVPQRLRDAGVPAGALSAVAGEAAAGATVRANPKPVSEAQILDLLRAAW